MSNYTKEDILRIAREEDIEFIRLQFTDIFGKLKNMAVTSSQLTKALNNQCVFDGSSIEGFVEIEESDLYLHPCLDTFTVFPWRPQQGKVARLICDICRPDGTPFEGDPRLVLKRAIAQLEEEGYRFEVGPECEFFLFDTDDNGVPTTHTGEVAGYFEMGPNDFGENARRDMVLTLEEMGFEVEASHHEASPGQHEIDFRYKPALRTADDIMTAKLAIQTVARRHGMYATFMPKPTSGVNGSGMHINMSLSKDGKNVFSDPSDENGLSREAYYFIGGLMEHVYAMSAVTNPLVNSYKRLVSGFEAPIHIAWSVTNRSPLIRIPSVREESMRVELRSPDSAANPYLMLALCLLAGLDGIKRKIMPPAAITKNIYQLSEAECGKLGIRLLPTNLKDALDAMEQDGFVRDVLGDHITDAYLAAKRSEWDAYCRNVSEWEVAEYLNQY